ncbi:hypothetical protein EDD85DRAFT_947749 [Armillaria nabsnona]|nr:hypothetical protein EDD85DRAFT_947749 [Armillaria nabsnona]
MNLLGPYHVQNVQASHLSPSFRGPNSCGVESYGPTGTNECGMTPSQDSTCQNLYSLGLLCTNTTAVCPGPSTLGTHSGDDRIDVLWCLKSRHATSVIPPGTIKGAHFMQTSDFVQVTGVGDFMKLNIHKDDAGGELNPNGTPLVGFIYSSAFGTDTRDQVFDSTSCLGDSGLLMGTVTLHQGDASSPILSYSQCTSIPLTGGATVTGSPTDD